MRASYYCDAMTLNCIASPLGFNIAQSPLLILMCVLEKANNYFQVVKKMQATFLR